MEPLGILVATPNLEIPVEPFPFYVASQKGWIISTPTLFGAARTLTKEAPSTLPEVKESFLLNGKLLPKFILSQFHDFARKNFAANKAECSAYIIYNDTTDRFRLFIPEQYVTHTSVNHRVEAGAIRKGFRAIGTIHSHCDFGAFHSGTDKHDMGKMPGLHITIGHVDRDIPEFVFALSVGDASFDVQYDQIIDNEAYVDHNGYNTAPDRWLGFVHTGTAPWNNGIKTTFYQPTKVHQTGYRYAPTTHHQTGYQGWQHSEWDSDYYGYYRKRDTAPPPPRNTPNDSLYQQQQLNIEAFERFAEFVQDSERVLEEETIQLAYLGFNLNYNITFNTERAKKFLISKGYDPDILTEAEMEDDDLDTPLLPERVN